MNRSAFFKLLATTVPAPLAFPQIVRFPTLGPGGGIAPSNRLNLGLIGVGGMGTGEMKVFLGLSDIHMIGVCDVDRTKRTGAQKIVEIKYASLQGPDKYQGCGSYLDNEEFLARPDLDAVIVGTPDHWYALAVLATARAGKYIFCEKPIANSIAECRAMVDGVERSGVVFQTNNWRRFGAGSPHAIDQARGGHLAKITRVLVGMPNVEVRARHSTTSPLLRPPPPWSGPPLRPNWQPPRSPFNSMPSATWRFSPHRCWSATSACSYFSAPKAATVRSRLAPPRITPDPACFRPLQHLRDFAKK